MSRHTHTFRLRWLLPMGIADAQGWYRVVLHGVCPCGASWILAGEQHVNQRDRRVLTEER
jgi:hypothetical protein